MKNLHVIFILNRINTAKITKHAARNVRGEETDILGLGVVKQTTRMSELQDVNPFFFNIFR